MYRPVEGSDVQSILQACGRGYFVVGILGAGQEPTNHALKDIAALGSDFEKWGRKMVFLFPMKNSIKSSIRQNSQDYLLLSFMGWM